MGSYIRMVAGICVSQRLTATKKQQLCNTLLLPNLMCNHKRRFVARSLNCGCFTTNSRLFNKLSAFSNKIVKFCKPCEPLIKGLHLEHPWPLAMSLSE